MSAIKQPFALLEYPKIFVLAMQGRWLFTIALVLGMAICAYHQITLPWVLLGQVAFFLLIVNFGLLFLNHHNIHISLLVNIGLIADTIALTEVLIFTGGSTNPMTSLYFLPILMAALVCSVRFAWAVFCLCLIGYFSLFFWHLPFPLAQNQPQLILNIHLSGMWLTFAFSAAIITGWISWLVHAVNWRDLKLTRAHQQQQKNERLLSLGISAATLAHQLSTPMNNLFLLQDELKHHPDMPESCLADLNLMQKQLELCTESLQKLKASPQYDEEKIDLSVVFLDQLDQWRNLRPGVKLAIKNKLPEHLITHVNPLFWSALLNILNNAADAGTNEVEISSLILANQMLCINIYNRSGHLSHSQLQQAGLTVLNSNKPAGMGLGVMLSHATLAHIGGSVTLKNHSEGGVHAQILLPLSLEKETT